MRGKGISYDTGFINRGVISREPFDPEVVRREVQIIRNDLHCNVIRITGGDPARLEFAAASAAQAGLEVWFSPFTCDLTAEEMLGLLADCAERAERIRLGGAEIVFVVGAELSLMNRGFLPGDTLGERMELLNVPHRLRGLIAEVPARMNDFLGRAAAVVRGRFGGKLTYASMPFEGIDWTPFDYIAVDLYRSIEIADQFTEGVRRLVTQGKPVAITEFGSCTYRGAADRGARGGSIVEWNTETVTPLGLNGDYIRDEFEQAAYLRELLEAFDAEGVDTAIAFTFADYGLPHRSDPRDDLDLASYGVVKVLDGRLGDTYPDMTWEPKAAFKALAEYYRG